MRRLPDKLARLIELFDSVPDRAERMQLLIDMADRFKPVPERVARRPFPEQHRTPACESDAFVWAEPRQDGTLQFHFAVENPQGVSAMALAVILDETLSGARPELVAAVPQDIVFKLFGNELSLGKGIGLMGMVSMVQNSAKRFLGAASPPAGPGDAT